MARPWYHRTHRWSQRYLEPTDWHSNALHSKSHPKTTKFLVVELNESKSRYIKFTTRKSWAQDHLVSTVCFYSPPSILRWYLTSNSDGTNTLRRKILRIVHIKELTVYKQKLHLFYFYNRILTLKIWKLKVFVTNNLLQIYSKLFINLLIILLMWQ